MKYIIYVAALFFATTSGMSSVAAKTMSDVVSGFVKDMRDIAEQCKEKCVISGKKKWDVAKRDPKIIFAAGVVSGFVPAATYYKIKTGLLKKTGVVGAVTGLGCLAAGAYTYYYGLPVKK